MERLFASTKAFKHLLLRGNGSYIDRVIVYIYIYIYIYIIEKMKGNQAIVIKYLISYDFV